MTPTGRRIATAAAAIIGVALFIYAVRVVGVAEILDGIRRVGWGILLILALGGARFLIRAECWRLCVPQGLRAADDVGPGLTFGHALVAFLAGDAVGSVTPLGLLASEPTKVLLTRHHLATREAVSSLALENLVYAASVMAMIALGIVVLLATVPLPLGWREVLMGALAASAVAFAGGMWLVRHGLGGAAMQRPRWREKLSALRAEVRRFSQATFARVFLLELSRCYSLRLQGDVDFVAVQMWRGMAQAHGVNNLDREREQHEANERFAVHSQRAGASCYYAVSNGSGV